MLVCWLLVVLGGLVGWDCGGARRSVLDGGGSTFWCRAVVGGAVVERFRGVDFGDASLDGIRRWRKRWLQSGDWFEPSLRASGWSGDEQLENLPDRVRSARA